jgi:hypothetical protein
MKNQRRMKKVSKKETYEIMNSITSDLISRFNNNIDDADEALAKLEMMCIILNKANRFKSQPREILEAFYKAFPDQPADKIVPAFIKRDLEKMLIQKVIQN